MLMSNSQEEVLHFSSFYYMLNNKNIQIVPTAQISDSVHIRFGTTFASNRMKKKILNVVFVSKHMQLKICARLTNHNWMTVWFYQYFLKG